LSIVRRRVQDDEDPVLRGHLLQLLPAELAREARYRLEAVLELLCWPKDEAVFHRAIDRLLQLEEENA
jgi:hypothetical protein